MSTSVRRNTGARTAHPAWSLDFDWSGGRIRGTSEKKPVDLALKEGTQDVMSIQVEVMLDLRKGDLPKTFHIVDKDELKEFEYSQEGTAKLKTALGDLDTVIVASRRARQQSHPANVVCAVARLRAGTGGENPRRQIGICDADPDADAIARASGLRQRDAALALVLAAAVR